MNISHCATVVDPVCLSGSGTPRGGSPVGQLRRGRAVCQDAAGRQHLRRFAEGHCKRTDANLRQEGQKRQHPLLTAFLLRF